MIAAVPALGISSGKIVVRYADHEETINGQAFMAPGHVPEALEDRELVQFSPVTQMRETIEVMRRKAQATTPTGDAPASRRATAEIVRRTARVAESVGEE